MLCMYDNFSVNEGEKYVSGNNKYSIIKNRKEFYLRNSRIVVLNLDIR